MAIGGGTVSAIRAISSSEMTPGPLGMAETRPNADAPQAIASAASAGDLMQQILTLGRVGMGSRSDLTMNISTVVHRVETGHSVQIGTKTMPSAWPIRGENREVFNYC